MNPLLANSLIRDVPDFPQPGILFKDITPVLSDPLAMREVISEFVNFARKREPTVILGIESRGFVFGMPVALELGLPFVPVRKAGKLPYSTIKEEYTLEYGTNVVEMHTDAVRAGDRIVIIDDLLATGGTASASARLAKKLGGEIVGFCFLIELEFLHGRAMLPDECIQSLVKIEA